MSDPTRLQRWLNRFSDRRQTGETLIVVGWVGVGAAVAVGILGMVLVGKARDSAEDTIAPVVRVVTDVTASIDASQVMVSRTQDAIESIETATRSTVRTMVSVSEVIDQTAALAGGEIASGLESAVETLPGLVSTAAVIDRTMRALSFVGVDYDVEVPLDQSLADLETSLAPIPDQIREQVALLETVRDDVDVVAEDARRLSAVLFESRLDMIEAERVLASAGRNAADAQASLERVRDGVGTYASLARAMVIAAAIALLAAALAPLLLGYHLQRSGEAHPVTDQPAT